MNDFYITLPSSVWNPQFENTSSRYITRLPEVLSLERDKYVVALTDIIYPYSYINIGRNLEYYIHFKDNRTPLHVTIPAAQYNNIDQVLDVLNAGRRRFKRSNPLSTDELNQLSAIMGVTDAKKKKDEPSALDVISFVNQVDTKEKTDTVQQAKEIIKEAATDKKAEVTKVVDFVNKIEDKKVSDAAVAKKTDTQKLVDLVNKVDAVETKEVVDLVNTIDKKKPLVVETKEAVDKKKPLVVETKKVVDKKEPLVVETKEAVDKKKPLVVETKEAVDKKKPLVVETKEIVDLVNKVDAIETKEIVDLVNKVDAIETKEVVDKKEPLVVETKEAVDKKKPLVVETKEAVDKKKPLVVETKKVVDKKEPLVVETKKVVDKKEPLAVETKEIVDLVNKVDGVKTKEIVDLVNKIETKNTADTLKNVLKKEEPEKDSKTISTEQPLDENKSSKEASKTLLPNELAFVDYLVFDREKMYDVAKDSYKVLIEKLLNVKSDQRLMDKIQYAQMKKDLERVRVQLRPDGSSRKSTDYIRFSSNNGRISVDMFDSDVSFVEFDDSCAYFLGFLDKIVVGSQIAGNTIDFFGNVSTFYLYCDIVDQTIVGDQKNSLLAVLPCKGNYGEMVHHSFPQARYLPIMYNTIDSIKIELLSEFAEPIHFNWGSTVVVLHFKKIIP